MRHINKVPPISFKAHFSINVSQRTIFKQKNHVRAAVQRQAGRDHQSWSRLHYCTTKRQKEPEKQRNWLLYGTTNKRVVNLCIFQK